MTGGIHAIFAGPLKDPNRVRGVHHGELRVTAHGLWLKLNDGRTVLVALDGLEMLALVDMLRVVVGQADV